MIVIMIWCDANDVVGDTVETGQSVFFEEQFEGIFFVLCESVAT